MASIGMPAIGVSVPFPLEEVEVYEKDGKKRKIEVEVKESAICRVIGKPVGTGPPILFEEGEFCPLFEIIGARIRHLGSEKYARMVGTIEMHYSEGISYLYRSDKDSAETVELPGELKLSTPNHAVLGYEAIYVIFYLEGDFEKLNEVHFSWWEGSFDIPFDKIWRRINGEGKCCSMEFSSIMHSEAVLADMEIKLRMHSRKFGTGIYGKATASLTKYKEEGLEFNLFNKENKDSILEYVGDEYDASLIEKESKDSISEGVFEFNVPLSRSVIAVPLGSALDIEVDAFASGDVLIASGIARFEPTYHGEHVGMICGEYGTVEVKVTFSSYRHHPATIRDRHAFRTGQKVLCHI